MGFLDIYIMLAGAPWGAAPIDDIRREGGGGSRKAANLRTNTFSILWTNMEGWVQNYVDVIYGAHEFLPTQARRSNERETKQRTARYASSRGALRRRGISDVSDHCTEQWRDQIQRWKQMMATMAKKN